MWFCHRAKNSIKNRWNCSLKRHHLNTPIVRRDRQAPERRHVNESSHLATAYGGTSGAGSTASCVVDTLQLGALVDTPEATSGSAHSPVSDMVSDGMERTPVAATGSTTLPVSGVVVTPLAASSASSASSSMLNRTLSVQSKGQSESGVRDVTR